MPPPPPHPPPRLSECAFDHSEPHEPEWHVSHHFYSNWKIFPCYQPQFNQHFSEIGLKYPRNLELERTSESFGPRVYFKDEEKEAQRDTVTCSRGTASEQRAGEQKRVTPRWLQALRNERGAFWIALPPGQHCTRRGLDVQEIKGTLALLNSPRRKFQGARGRCGGFSKAGSGALLAGTQARCPHVPSADAGPPAAVHPARAARPHQAPASPGRVQNTPREPPRIPARGKCRGGGLAATVSLSPLPSFPGRSLWRQRKQ